MSIVLQEIKWVFKMLFFFFGLLLLLEIGDVVLLCTNERYRGRRQISVWESKVREFYIEQEKLKQDSINDLKLSN